MKRKATPTSYFNNPLLLKPWLTLTSLQKRSEIVRYALRQNGSALTLNLGANFGTYLVSNETPMRAVGKRMNAELRKLDLHHVPILMVLEATKQEQRLHLHGVYIGDGISKQRIQQAMRRAVGYVEGRKGSRQFYSRQLYYADGWMNYLKKDSKFTRRILNLVDNNRLCWTSRSMTQLVRDDYEAVRLGQKATANNSGPLRTQI